ncbi:TIR domain-containing adapter molecule 1-like [Amblyraja radiata]|uniref:TIR domain-containing adapter molecule 1-like n=1 Tax=Amblyraja radiata TaxID=386614 RepID=UPI0014020F6B|nr:TIR domain-containing adapter molecule 1-like [Amblyraja radiata]
MAEDCDRTPSLDDVFDILSGVPEARLFSLWYKFTPGNSKASMSHRHLYSIVSFFLKKDKEAEKVARSVLKERSTNKSALCIYNRVQGLVDAAGREKRPPENSNKDLSVEDGSLLADLALMFGVLVEENLCSPSIRNRACRAAIRAIKSNKQDCNMELQEVVEKFRMQFGLLDFDGEDGNAEISALKSMEEPVQGRLTTMAFRTNPMTNLSQIAINPPCTSEITLPTHFEISASPTASFTTNLSPDDLELSNPDDCTINSANFNTVGSNNDNLPSSDNCLASGKQIHDIGDQHRGEQDLNSLCSAQLSSGDNVIKVGPSQCTGRTSSDQIVTSKSKMSQELTEGNGKDTNSISYDPSQKTSKLKASNRSNSSESPTAKSSSLGEPPEVTESSEDIFYPFVVLHVPEDIEIAEEVRDKLESLGVKGTTIDHLAVPGRSPIKCIEDAINNSAFTILLLTNNFNTRWADYEANVTLMHSINNEHKYNTVVPLLPKKNSLRTERIPFALRAIVSLNENSSHFEKHVKNIFKSRVLEKHRRGWLQQQRQKQIHSNTNRIKQDLQDTRETISNERKYMDLINQLNELKKHCPNFQPTFVSDQGNIQGQPMLHPPLYPGSSTLPMPPVSPNQLYSNILTPSLFPFTNPSSGPGGQNIAVNNPLPQHGQGTNIIQIHHAKNVQIGDSNQMTITECIENSESTDDDKEEEEEEESVNHRHI